MRQLLTSLLVLLPLTACQTDGSGKANSPEPPQNTVLALTAENLALVAATLSPEFSLRRYVMERPGQADQDPTETERIIAELESRAAALRSPEFKLERTVRLGRIGTGRDGIPLKLFKNNQLGVTNFGGGKEKQMPWRLLSLVPNWQHGRMWPMSAEQAQAWNRTLEERSVRSVLGRAEAHLKPVRYLGAGQFQLALVDVQVEGDQGEPLYRWALDTSPESVIDASLLRQGVTWDIAEIHSYAVFGIRLLEIIPEGADWLGNCRQQQDAEHILTVCDSTHDQFGFPVRLSRLFRGGRLESVQYTALQQATTEDLNRIAARVAQTIQVSIDPAKFAVQKYKTHFEFDRSMAKNDGNEKPFFTFTALASPLLKETVGTGSG